MYIFLYKNAKISIKSVLNNERNLVQNYVHNYTQQILKIKSKGCNHLWINQSEIS